MKKASAAITCVDGLPLYRAESTKGYVVEAFLKTQSMQQRGRSDIVEIRIVHTARSGDVTQKSIDVDALELCEITGELLQSGEHLRMHLTLLQEPLREALQH